MPAGDTETDTKVPSTTLDGIQETIESLRKIVEDTKKITDILNGPRSGVIKLINATDLSLVLTFHDHDSGGFAASPPATIAPKSAVMWGTQSGSWSIGTGAIGTAHYAGDGLEYYCDWNIPFAGKNSASVNFKDATGRFRETHVSGAGNTEAKFEYTLYQLPEQDDWRSCHYCQALYFDGRSENKGLCPGRKSNVPTIDGKIRHLPHETNSWSYFLSYNFTPAPNQVHQWRFCRKCNGLFYDGHPAKGVCADGTGHHGEGFDFLIPFVTDIKPARMQQGGWRVCEDCFGLFFTSGPVLGHCFARGDRGHRFVADSHDYALNYR